jgi:hypothetical protein
MQRAMRKKIFHAFQTNNKLIENLKKPYVIWFINKLKWLAKKDSKKYNNTGSLRAAIRAK